MLRFWDFTSMMGLANMKGTWDPMWTSPKMKLRVGSHIQYDIEYCRNSLLHMFGAH